MAKEFHNLPIIGFGRLLGGRKFAESIGAVFFINHRNEALISLAKAYTLVSRGIAASYFSVGSILRDARLSKVDNPIVAFVSINMIDRWVRPAAKSEPKGQVVGEINSLFPGKLSVAIWTKRPGWTISRDALLKDEPPKMPGFWIITKNLTKLFNRKPVGIDRFCAHWPTLTVAHIDRQGNSP